MAINYAFGAATLRYLDDHGWSTPRRGGITLYPLSLVAVEERFGSWMTQYGYTNYLTAQKLMELGEVLPDGTLKVKEKTYGTLVILFEPFPEKGLLDMLTRFMEKGGKVLWFGTPPLLDSEGKDCTSQWQQLAGVTYRHDGYMGEIAAGKEITFGGSFSGIPPQTILTDFLVDRIYPAEPNGGEVVALCDGKCVGVKTEHGQGTFYYLGFRPRDDQSRSLGYESRTLFELLHAANAYPATGKIANVNDNPTVCPHLGLLRHHVPERDQHGSPPLPYPPRKLAWRFFHDAERHPSALAVNPLPPDTLERQHMINGHRVTYNGTLSMAFHER